MEKIQSCVVTLLLLSLWMNSPSLMARDFSGYLVDWSLHEEWGEMNRIPIEELPEGSPLTVDRDEPMLVREESEEYLWVKVASLSGLTESRALNARQRLLFFDERKLQFMDGVEHRALARLKNLRMHFESHSQFNDLVVVEKSIQLLEVIKPFLYIGESDFSKRSVVDSFKCVLNKDRHFFAIVHFVEDKIVLKSIGVCQRFFADYLSQDATDREPFDEGAKSFMSFLMSISGKSRVQSQKIVEL